MRCRVTLLGRTLIPGGCRRGIARDAFAERVRHAEAVLGHGAALLGRTPVPAHRLGIVLGHAFTERIGDGEIVLGVTVTLLRGAPIPGDGSGSITRDTFALVKHIAEVRLRVGIAALGQRAEQARAAREITRSERSACFGERRTRRRRERPVVIAIRDAQHHCLIARRSVDRFPGSRAQSAPRRGILRTRLGGFGGFGGFGGRRGGPQRGRHLEQMLRITFIEAAFGTEKEMEVTRPEVCGECGGSGAAKGSGPTTCGTCGGVGEVIHRQGGLLQIRTTCPQCRGSGQVIEEPCEECKGRGAVPVEVTLKVEVPAGVESGMRIRFAGKGEPGQRGGPPGDLFIVLQVERHEIFERDGNDVLCQVEVGIAQAALGADVEVPTLTGSETLKIPAGTQHGAILRFRGEGIPRLRGGGRGDQVMQVLVRVPKKLSDRQRELLEEYAEIEGSQVRKDKGGLKGLFGKLKN